MKTLKQLEEEIRLQAYELYEIRGRVDGHDMDHWLEAERIVMSRYFGVQGENQSRPVAEEAGEEKPRRPRRAGSSPGRGRKTRSS